MLRREDEMEAMDDLIKIDAKRLKTMEICTVNSTESTTLFFAAPCAEDTDPYTFLEGQTGFQPTFTYPFFGQEELFKGVSEASLQICFHPVTFFAYISLQVDEDSEDMKGEIMSQLTVHLPKGIQIYISYIRNWFVSWVDGGLEQVRGTLGQSRRFY